MNHKNSVALRTGKAVFWGDGINAQPKERSVTAQNRPFLSGGIRSLQPFETGTRMLKNVRFENQIRIRSTSSSET